MRFFHLTGSFGRRLLLLLLFCIGAPGLVFGYLSLHRVETKFREDQQMRMQMGANVVAATIYGNLAPLEAQAGYVSELLGNDRVRKTFSPVEWAMLSSNSMLLAASVVRDDSRISSLFGNPCIAPDKTPESRIHMQLGKNLLYHLSAGGNTRLFMARAIPGIPVEREYLVCELNPDIVLGSVDAVVPAQSNVAVLSPEGTPVYSSSPIPEELLLRVVRERKSKTTGGFQWEGNPQTLLAYYSGIYLKASYLSDNWTVVLVNDRKNGFVFDRFSWFLLLSVLLVVLSSGLFAVVHLRRSMEPLSVLKEGTKRISEGDFGNRVEIDSGDEFEELARSFNVMADTLGKEFRIKEGMGRTLQSILSETEKGKIVRALLTNVGSVVPCDRAGVSLLDLPGKPGSAPTCTREGSASDPSGIGRIMTFLEASEFERLQTIKTAVATTPEGEFRGFFSRWPQPHPATFLLSPLVYQGELLGLLSLGYMDPQEPETGSLERLRQVADQVSVALSRAALVEEVHENDMGILHALSRAVDTNSHWTSGHSQRVTDLAMEIGWELGLPPKEVDLLHRGGLLHDIGKLGVPSAILDKPGKLTEEEFAIVKRHPSSGAEILRPIPALQNTIPIVVQHHERYDGSGYPLGLPREDISIHARILAVADVVDALTSNRPYRSGWPREKVLSYILENSGKQFDPGVVNVFMKIAAGKNAQVLMKVPWFPSRSKPQGEAGRPTGLFLLPSPPANLVSVGDARTFGPDSKP